MPKINKRDVVYISGKISGRPEKEWRRHFMGAETALRAVHGCETRNPVEISDELNRTRCRESAPLILGCPGFRNKDGSPSYKCYLKHDYEHIFECTAVYALVGWHESKGAIAELTLAEALGLKIEYEDIDTSKVKIRWSKKAARRGSCRHRTKNESTPGMTGPAEYGDNNVSGNAKTERPRRRKVAN